MQQTLTRTYLALVAVTARFDKSAALYLMTKAPRLSSFNKKLRERPYLVGDKVFLSQFFFWSDTPQGTNFWRQLNDLVGGIAIDNADKIIH